ncbi:MAG: hypothetical protein M3Q27_16585 [Actinomycetota bacterium]|nr:hypothetical protein [Actinomycetota bacterium]
MGENFYNPEAVPLPDLRDGGDDQGRPRPHPGEGRSPADVELQSVSPSGEPTIATVEESLGEDRPEGSVP